MRRTGLFFGFACLLLLASGARASGVPEPEPERLGVGNLIPNSGFEQATGTGIPGHWGTFHWGLWEALPSVAFEEWRERWSLDSAEKFQGEKSFRISSPSPTPQRSLYLTSCWIYLRHGIYTFSAYLKGSRPGQQAVLEIMDGGGNPLKSETVTLTDQWARYSVSGFLKTNKAMVSIHPLSAGTLWADAMQLEAGDAATAYRESFLDRPINTVPVEYGRIDRPPAFDGTLGDPAWAAAPEFQLTQLWGEDRINDSTTVRLLGDERNLYLGLKCVQPAIGQWPEPVRPRDRQLWREPDSVDIFLSPEADSLPFYMLSFDWAGNRSDFRNLNPDWDGNWQVKTARRDGMWTAEAVVPWALLKKPEGNRESWRFNIRRFNRGRDESVLFPLRAHWLTPGRFGYLAGVPARMLDGIRLEIERMELLPVAPRQYLFRLSVRNGNPEARDLRIVAAVADSNHPERDVRTVSGKVAPGETEVFEIGPFELDETKRYPNVSAEIFDRDSGELYAFQSRNFQKQPDVSLRITPDRSFYTREDSLDVEVSTPYPLPATVRGRLRWKDASGNSLPDRAFQPGQPVKVDMTGWTPGVYQLCAEFIAADGTVTASAVRNLTRLPPSGFEAKFDLNRNALLVNGKPFLPLGIHWEMALETLTPETLKAIRALGFNTVSIQFRPTATREQIGRVLDRLQQADLKCIFSFWIKKADPKHLETLETFIGAFKSHPAVLAWLTLDEPDGWNGHEFAETAWKRNKELDPYRPAFVNYTPAMTFNMELPTDIRILDHYPVPEEDIRETPRHVERLGQARQPVWFFLQVSGHAYFFSREPTPEEFTFMAFSSLIKGATGLVCFAQLPHSGPLREAIARLFPVFSQYAPVFLGDRWSSGEIASESQVLLSTREASAERYILALNRLNAPQRIEIALSGVEGVHSVTELVSGRKIEVKGSRFQDDCTAFQHKIYRLSRR